VPYLWNAIVFPDLTAAEAAALTGIAGSYSLYDAINDPRAIPISTDPTYSPQFLFHGAAAILNSAAAVQGVLDGRYLNFPYSLVDIITAIRFAYFALAAGDSSRLEAQLNEFAKMSDYCLEDHADCHCKHLPDGEVWDESECVGLPEPEDRPPPSPCGVE
jgi:hypothetical protein